ncbi:MAG: hypothetical protein HC834_10915 [Rhodospirillales bacterium]|nr:hypothetical protein [Rhodospirillales bacterium]
MDSNLRPGNASPSPDAAWSGNQQRFDEDVLSASSTIPIVALFWTPWNAGSSELVATLGAAVRSVGGEVRFVAIDIDKNRHVSDILARFGLSVDAVPVVVVYWQGQPWKVIQGTPSQENIERFVANVRNLGEGVLKGPAAPRGDASQQATTEAVAPDWSATHGNAFVTECNDFLAYISQLDSKLQIIESNANSAAESMEKTSETEETLFHRKRHAAEREIEGLDKSIAKIESNLTQPEGPYEVAERDSRSINAVIASVITSLATLISFSIYTGLSNFMWILAFSMSVGLCICFVLYKRIDEHFEDKRRTDIKNLNELRQREMASIRTAKEDCDKKRRILLDQRQRVLADMRRELSQARAEALAKWERIDRALRSEAKNQVGALGVLGGALRCTTVG